MNVASLELCRELYEASHWDGYDNWVWTVIGTRIEAVPIEKVGFGQEGKIVCPAYTVGYLLRKLPPSLVEHVVAGDSEWWRAFTNSVGVHGTEADTPENAACKLAIELLKAGVLQKAAV